MNLQLGYGKSDSKDVLPFIKSLEKLSHNVFVVKDVLLDEEGLVLIPFTSSTDEADLLSTLGFLRRQKDFSSIPYLKIMPVFLYHSSKEDPEVAFEGNAGKVYEDIFSGEFKPYGWDLDAIHPEIEFDRVLESYLE